MPLDLNQIDTIFVVIMENRSFDHMLGYLSLPEYGRNDVEGQGKFSQPVPYVPFRMPDPRAPLPGDPPHERQNIAEQLGLPQPESQGLVYPMNGFVDSYPGSVTVNGDSLPIVMGYFNGEDLPTNDFFARNFTICDHWFAPLPAGTQPNRLMAMSGQTLIDVNKDVLPDQPLVYDWLETHAVRWRVYHEGLPFFSLMPSWLDEILLGNHFSSFDNFARDIQTETDQSFPQVIFVEPRYTNAPHIDTPHDDHAPSAVDGGQRFLMQVYAALTAKPERWNKSLMIVTYDEHGGFFDHVSPLPVHTVAPEARYPEFVSSGVRVPAFIISPFVEAGSTFAGNLDHTSILQLIGEKFANGGYSDDVSSRKDQGIGSISDVPALQIPRADTPAPPGITEGFTTDGMPDDPMSRAFAKAWAGLRATSPLGAAERFPKLFGHFK